MKSGKKVSVYGLGGDVLVAPDHSEVAFRAALAGGADGIVLSVRLSRDGVLVCSNSDDFMAVCGDNRRVDQMTWSEIGKLDAGYSFQSMEFDPEAQFYGNGGKDWPWRAKSTDNSIRVMQLRNVLQLFSRQCAVHILLPTNYEPIIDEVVNELRSFGVLDRVSLIGNILACQYLAKKYPASKRVIIDETDKHPIELLRISKELRNVGLYLDLDQICAIQNGSMRVVEELLTESRRLEIPFIVGSKRMPISPKPAYIQALEYISEVEGLIVSGVIPTVELITPKGLMVESNFEGKEIDRELWSAGYSHINTDSTLFQSDGLYIKITEGGSYSGAAAVCLIPFYKRFDAMVDFSVDNPTQGTTLELAAISIDPGYHHIENTNLDTTSVNLTFDVHGAPPYASSERDEDDGFRCGWNNGFNLAKIDPGWEASSVNMFNKYGRDVGNGNKDNPTGTLRLLRNGQYFATYYRDKYNTGGWVCSGAMLVHNMPDYVYIRLAGKHWKKKNSMPPSNEIRFSRFKVYQF